MYKVTGNMIYIAAAPPGTPDNVIAELRIGFQKALGDPEFAKQTMKITGIPPEFVSVKEGKTILRDVDKVDPKIVRYLEKLMSLK